MRRTRVREPNDIVACSVAIVMASWRDEEWRNDWRNLLQATCNSLFRNSVGKVCACACLWQRSAQGLAGSTAQGQKGSGIVAAKLLHACRELGLQASK
eukprot:4944768-Amphidinium_carterae.1